MEGTQTHQKYRYMT